MKPLADRIRPKGLEDVVGQKHIIGKGKIIDTILENNFTPNMIFYGPPGVGKTTVAHIIAEKTNRSFYKLNATNASLSDVKDIISQIDTLMNSKGILLYLDEIQNFNKKQQQALLEFIENGKITLIASTTENPYFYIYNAILSRSNIFEFKPLSNSDIKDGLKRAIEVFKDEYRVALEAEESCLDMISHRASGDLRSAINTLELLIFSSNRNADGTIKITTDDLNRINIKKTYNYDKDGDNHYNVLSAFQKSIRGSDSQGAIHYLARLIKGGDLKSICRRLLVIASEDIGMAYPTAITIVKSCVDAALMLGLPEARIVLSQATIVLATAPKSNSAIIAIDKALNDLDNLNIGDIPESLKDAHYEGAKKLNKGVGYIYPHNFENNYIRQQYLPNEIKHEKYYIPQNNKLEDNIKKYWDKIDDKLF
ncbi:MAG: replication-associated recombination protein A [Clostridiaceae bacterium]